jgi:hypothetical protein
VYEPRCPGRFARFPGSRLDLTFHSYLFVFSAMSFLSSESTIGLVVEVRDWFRRRCFLACPVVVAGRVRLHLTHWIV